MHGMYNCILHLMHVNHMRFRYIFRRYFASWWLVGEDLPRIDGPHTVHTFSKSCIHMYCIEVNIYIYSLHCIMFYKCTIDVLILNVLYSGWRRSRIRNRLNNYVSAGSCPKKSSAPSGSSSATLQNRYFTFCTCLIAYILQYILYVHYDYLNKLRSF